MTIIRQNFHPRYELPTAVQPRHPRRAVESLNKVLTRVRRLKGTIIAVLIEKLPKFKTPGPASSPRLCDGGKCRSRLCTVLIEPHFFSADGSQRGAGCVPVPG